MTDAIPTQAWLVLMLAVMAAGPAIYVWRHFKHGLPDITQPPEDLSWRSTAKLYRSLASLVGLLAVGVFIFTPWAKEFAESDYFVPTLTGAFGAFALGRAAVEFSQGKAEPLVKGFNATYDREEQPARYWASLGWNTVLGGALLALSATIFQQTLTPRCDDYTDDKDKLAEALITCNALLAEAATDSASRADLLHARGRVQHDLGNHARALADYTAALEIDPDNSYALFNRGLIHAVMGNQPRAIEDFNASLELRPDNYQAYHERGLSYLNMGMFNEAIADMTLVHTRDPDHEYALSNRGIAYAWLNNAERAEADFRTFSPGDPAWPVVLRGRAVLAEKRGDYRSAIALLTEALHIDPEDEFSLSHRADAYWKIGQLDLARDDDDRLTALRSPSQPIVVGRYITLSPEGTVTQVVPLPEATSVD